MCLIINKKAKQVIKPGFFEDVTRRNRDGWGMMWINRRGKPTMIKGVKMSDFYREYERLQHKDVAIHFRFTTDGLTNWDNAHPHQVLDDVFMMHNGVLSGFRKPKDPRDKDMSDTAIFVKEVVRPLLEENGGADYVRTIEFDKEMKKYTGIGNKLIFLDKEGFNVIEPTYWSYSLSGLQVSNTNFSVDCPNHNYGYNHTRKNSYKEGDDNYGKTSHNSQGRFCEFGDGDMDMESYFAEVYGPSRTDDVGTVPTPPVRKDPPLSLVANNDNSKKELDLKKVSDSSDPEDYMWILDMKDDEIESLIDVDRPTMAKLIRAALQERKDYGYNKENFRASGI